MKIFVADVGGTFTKFALMNERAEIFERGKIPTPKNNREEFFNTLAELYKNFSAEGFSLSMPGIIDAERGICLKSAAFSFNDGCNIVEEIKKFCDVKIKIENDSNCAAFAEVKVGNLSDVNDAFVMVFGTMIGGTFIKNKKIHRGKNNSSGEISFLYQTFDSEKYFSEICSVPNLLKSFGENISGEKFFELVEEKNKFAIECLNKFTENIAVQIFNIQMILDVEKIAIGGGISSQKIFIESIRKNFEKLCKKSPLDIQPLEIVPCKFYNDANLIGALYNFLES